MGFPIAGPSQWLSRLILLIVIFMLGVPAYSQTPQNVRVNRDGSGTGKDQNETTIAVNPLNPQNLVAGSHYWVPVDTTVVKHIAYYFSTDAGQNWAEGFLPPGGSYDRVSDPWVAFSAGGVVYYSHISWDLNNSQKFSDNGLFVNKSTDGGAHWRSNPYRVVQHGDGTGPLNQWNEMEDKPAVACDGFTGSPYRDNVYVAWSKLSKSADNVIYFSRMVPSQADSFQSPVALSGHAWEASGAYPVVGYGGVLYVFWYEPPNVIMRRSTNGGITFSTADTVVRGIADVPWVKSPLLRANSLPSVAVDPAPTGQLFVVWTDKRDNNPDIYMTV